MSMEKRLRKYLPNEDMTGYIKNNGKLSRERYEYALMVIYQLSVGNTYANAAKLIKRPVSSCQDMVYRTGQMWGTLGATATVCRAIRMGFIV
jgi:hypothetical protein